MLVHTEIQSNPIHIKYTLFQAAAEVNCWSMLENLIAWFSFFHLQEVGGKERKSYNLMLTVLYRGWFVQVRFDIQVSFSLSCDMLPRHKFKDNQKEMFFTIIFKDKQYVQALDWGQFMFGRKGVFMIPKFIFLAKYSCRRKLNCSPPGCYGFGLARMGDYPKILVSVSTGMEMIMFTQFRNLIKPAKQAFQNGKLLWASCYSDLFSS